MSDRPRLIVAGAAWRSEPGAANDYLKGKINIAIPAGTKFFIFHNDRPTQETSPTHTVMIEDPRGQPAERPAEDKYKTNPPADSQSGGGDFGGPGQDDIPF